MTPIESAALIIPTLNAEPFLDRLLPALEGLIAPSRIWVIDSSSNDKTATRFREFGANVHIIARKDFNHGATRKLGTALARDANFLLFLTQDAIPAEPAAFATILSAFDDSNIGMAYGRQLPRLEAHGIESHARLVNYPAKSEVRDLGDRERLGIKTPFCSNSFAAYRRSALEAVGNFPDDAYFAEDQFVSAKMLLAGWKLAYVADACVFHSHAYSVLEDFRRYFDIGVFHSQNPWFVKSFGRPVSEGARIVFAELNFLRKRDPLAIPSAVTRAGAKYSAYHLGLMHHRLPNALKAHLGMHGVYWRHRAAKVSD